MIIKVVVIGRNADGAMRVLIKDKTQRFTYEGGVNPDVEEAMKMRTTAYFEASMGIAGLEIGDELDGEEW